MTITSINIVPKDATITGSRAYTATAVYSDIGKQSITNSPGVVWSTVDDTNLKFTGNILSVHGVVSETGSYIVWQGSTRVVITTGSDSASTGVTGTVHCLGFNLGPNTSVPYAAGTTLQVTGTFLFDDGTVIPIDITGSGYLSAASLVWHSPHQHIATIDGGAVGSDSPATGTPGVTHFWNSGSSTSVGATTASWGGCGGNTAQMYVTGTTDVGYGIRCPLSNSEWTTTPYLSPWGAMFGCQELSGPAIGSGSSGFTLAATASVEFGAQEVNWPRRFWHDHTTFDTGMMAGNGVGPDIRTAGAVAVLGYVKLVSVIASAPVMGFMNGAGGGPQEPFCVEARSTGKVFLSCSGSNSADSIADYRGKVHPFLIVYDPTNSRAKLYTDLEKVTGSYNSFGSTSALGIFKGFGANNMNAASGSICYLAFCTGSVASSLSDDGRASKFLKDLNWYVGW